MDKTLPFNGDALAIFRNFAPLPGAFFLDSSLKSPDAGRSFIGAQPLRIVTGNSLEQMQRLFSWQRRYKFKAVGYITYEGRFHFGLYPHWIEIDHAANRLYMHAATAGGMRSLSNLLAQSPSDLPKGKSQRFNPKSNFNQTAYERAVRLALAAIRRGDIYQLNLSRMIMADIVIDPLALYTALRTISPSPFAAYYDGGKEKILSSSPERFLKLDGRCVEVKPMKGTRPRGATKADDRKLYSELSRSAKEIAELLMVTDLERNDLGRVCELGSVTVKSMRSIERYAAVFQATSTIVGKLRKSCSTLDLIQAAFPSGSVTGCPKIAAMRFIKAIEKIPRGFYTGALGHIDPNGNMDLSVLIRTVLVSSTSVRYHVGGGIVADSNPSGEYAETTLKAQSIERAIREVLRA